MPGSWRECQAGRVLRQHGGSLEAETITAVRHRGHGTLRTQIRLTDEQSQALKSLASERRISVAELIRQAIEDLLRQSSTVRAEMKRRALAAAGRFRSGEKNLSTEHDDYLAEIDGDS